MNKRVLFLALILAGLTLLNAQATNIELSQVFSRKLGYPKKVLSHGNYAYVLGVEYNSILATYEVSDVQDTQLISMIDLGRTYSYSVGNDMVMEGNILCVIMYNSVQVFDISLPQDPQLLNDFDIPDGYLSAVLKNNRLYILISGMILSYNISDPLQPNLETTYAPDMGRELHVVGDNLIIYESPMATYLVTDISNPGEIIYLNQVSGLMGNIISFSGDKCHSRGSHTFYVYCVTEPLNPSLYCSISPVNSNYHASFLDVSGDKFYQVGWFYDGEPSGFNVVNLFSYDISDPNDPHQTQEATFTRGINIETDKHGLFLMNLQSSYGFIDMRGQAVLGNRFVNTAVNEVAANANLAFVDTRDYGIHSYFLNQPNPYYQAEVLSNQVTAMKAEGDLFVTTEGHNAWEEDIWVNGPIRLYDVSDPDTIRAVSSISQDFHNGVTEEIRIYGDKLLVANGYGPVLLYDISNLEQPSLICEIQLPGNCVSAVLHGNSLYLGSRIHNDLSRVTIYQLDSGPSPQELSILDFPYFLSEIQIHDNLLYVGAYSSIKTYDISNPAIAVETSGLNIDQPLLSFEISNNSITALTAENLMIYRLFGELNRTPVGSAVLPSIGVGMAISENQVLVGSVLQALSYDCSAAYDITANADIIASPAQSTLLNTPNPFRTECLVHFKATGSGSTRLDIYNIKGQLVRTLLDKHLMAGDYEVHWDGRDSRGIMCSGGIYLMRLQTPRSSQTNKLVKLY